MRNGRAIWRCGDVESPVGPIPQIRTALGLIDDWGALCVRLGIGRMAYRIPPGLYAVGQPTPEAPVLVTANYKLSFDRLRAALANETAWVLVLDTDGVNVWCAAGKGTFGTAELVRRICATRLAEIVTHRRLILPQLGAPGVAAHEVKKQSGFTVVYGPVYAVDIPAFLAAGETASPAMRSVRFPLCDRLVLVPVELHHWGLWLMPIALVMALLHKGLAGGTWFDALTPGLILLAAFSLSTTLTAALLPWLPGRAFSLKGLWVGLGLAAGATALDLLPAPWQALEGLGWWLLLCALSAFMAFNYTGTTTFTSPSGVKRELRLAGPLQALAALGGAGCWLAGLLAQA